MLNGFANVVFPTRDLQASVAAWTDLLGHGPVFAGDDFAAFAGDDAQIGLTGLSPEEEPTPQRLTEVAQQAKAAKATTIFFESLVSP